MRITAKLFLLFFLSLIYLKTLTAQEIISAKPDLTDPANISHWTLDGSGLWKIDNGQLILYKAGIPAPEGSLRRPSALAIFKTKSMKQVNVEANIQSLVDTATIHRDLEIIVGYESPTRFYYVHLAGTTDKVHNGIFLVDNADRKRIDNGKGIPQLKDKKWHHVQVTRDGDTGKIEVFVDGSKEPVLYAVDKTICCGQAGFGSFDDTGYFKNISINGTVDLSNNN